MECIEAYTLNGTQQMIRVDPHRFNIIAPNMEYVQVKEHVTCLICLPSRVLDLELASC
jgi:hypothetical protein